MTPTPHVLDRPEPGALWTPGNGWTNQREREAARALAEYEADLKLGFRQDIRQWAVFIDTPEGPRPIFGLGHELPAPEEIKKRLHNNDVRRQGAKIVDRIYRANEERKAAGRKAADDAEGIAAEGLDWAMRKQGALPQRIFVPRDI